MQKHTGFKYLIYISIVLMFVNVALAENVTVNQTGLDPTVKDTLDDVAREAKNLQDWIKQNVPYEFWEFLTFLLLIIAVMGRQSIQTQSGMWKLGIYMAIAAVMVYILMIL